MELIMGLALSLHIQLNGDYNHLHPYVGVESEKGYIAGAYYNSIDKLSLYTGYKMELGEDTSLELGAVTGYLDNPVPMASLNYKEMFVMPAVEDERVGFVLGVDFRF